MQNEHKIKLPFKSNFVEVSGSQMHYFDQGHGGQNKPLFLFLHGNPTSSYLWRNIIPKITESGFRCVAPDLIGMGLSDKPDIGYTLPEHISYINKFIKALDLENIILVGHDWGTAIALDYSRKNPENVKGVVLLEGLVNAKFTIQFPWPMRALSHMLMSSSYFKNKVLKQNMFVEKIMFEYGTLKKLSEEDKAVYRYPYPDPKSRKPLWVWPNQVPYNSKPKENSRIIEHYMEALFKCSIPVLLFWGKGGSLVKPKDVEFFREKIKNFTDINLGPIKHYFPEDYPNEISKKIMEWLPQKALQ